MPVHAAGMRKLPPMSVPTPNGLPPKAIRADSPPEEPPEVSLRFSGFTVRPKQLFTDSACILSAIMKSLSLFAYTQSSLPLVHSFCNTAQHLAFPVVPQESS